VIYALCRITSTTCRARCGLLPLTGSGAVVRHTGDLCKSIDVKNVQIKKRKNVTKILKNVYKRNKKRYLFLV